MKGYAAREVFTAEQQKLLRRATALIRPAPYKLDGTPIRCHELARAVGCIMRLPVQDGKHGLVDHSWLWTCAFDGKSCPDILDVYCVGRLPQVQLVSVGIGPGHFHMDRSLYQVVDRTTENELGGLGPLRDDIDEAIMYRLVDSMLGRSGFDPKPADLHIELREGERITDYKVVGLAGSGVCAYCGDALVLDGSIRVSLGVPDRLHVSRDVFVHSNEEYVEHEDPKHHLCYPAFREVVMCSCYCGCCFDDDRLHQHRNHPCRVHPERPWPDELETA